MKPVLLRLQAFSAYADEQTIDFRSLAGHTLMMISGETGAGKTALLDAMCYALFGQSTGQLRSERTLRSDHASKGILTYVDLQFELNSKVYRAHRRPPQVGQGTGLVEFFELSDIDDSDAKLMATGKTNVGKVVRGLLGYNVNQFRSVVMLPQGQFRDFLSADTKKKAELLSALFRTGRYALLQKSLKEKADTLEKAQAENLKRIDQSLKVAGAETEAELDSQIKDIDAQIKTRQSHQVKLSAECKAAEARLTNATRLTDDFRRRTEVQGTLSTLEKLKPARERERAELSNGKLAATLRDSEAHRTLRANEALQAQTEMKAAQSSLEQDEERVRLAREASAMSQEAKPNRDAAKRSFEGLKALVEPMKELTEATEQERVLKTQVSSDRKLLRAANSKGQGLENERQEVLETQKSLLPVVAEKDVAHRSLVAAKKMAAQVEKRQSLEVQATRTRTQLTDEIAYQEQLKTRVTKAQATYRTVYDQHLHAYAARLAEGLVDGDACPVCGSTAHPIPTQEGVNDPGEQAVHATRKAFREQEDAVGRQQLKIIERQSELSESEAQITVLKDAMAESQAFDLTDCEAHIRLAEASLKAVLSAEENLAAATRRLPILQALLQDHAKEYERLAECLKQGEQSLAVNEARLADRRMKVPEKYNSLDDLLGQIEAEEAAYAQAVKRAEEAESTATRVALEYTASVSRMESAKTRVASALVASQEAHSKFESRIIEAGFADFDIYNEARRTPEAMADLEGTLRHFDNEVTSAKVVLKHLNEQLAHVEVPKLDEIEDAVRSVQSRLATAESELVAFRENASPMHRARHEIDELRTASAMRETEYGIMATLRDVAQGKSPNQHGIQFERYVLAGLLDEVLIHASMRLNIMSNGRYTIQRKDPDRVRVSEFVQDKRRESGLELEVVDAFTGKERDAGTLSGGEGFQASLALALGLADVVQTQSGGIQLNAMFIDEGFGTQSEEALDAVLDTLTGLQSSGRLVGFISHVNELKTRIPAQLHVQKTPTGSHVEWRIR